MPEKNLVDLAQAWAPTVVAAVVAGLAWWQSQWQRRTAERQHALEVQQLKVALFERRLEVLKVVSGVLAHVSYERDLGEAKNEQLFQCLLEGQTLFGGDIAERLNQAWLDQVSYVNKRRNKMTAMAEGRADELKVEVDAAREKLFEDVEALCQDMISLTRVPGPSG
jgi:hypothetical protein